jgi:type 1 fimbriae regulatory protein FimB
MKPTGKAFFVSEQRKPSHRSTVNLALRKYSADASLPLLAHPHMLRHACGFALADQGADTRLIQDYLGHLEHSAHRQVHRDQSGKVREALALRSPRR